ncbi:hypothetical protein K493DRAFT_353468 [Basidiobolus meristosporus CBS 931.73]|uniref:CCDC174 alpha/beta GRSR domain-containing protein n=1 Tax=Basidiobolus meristosporus CBS 931.73 TaxID=1314790 RepID=A0A1Y1Y6Q8_9FUNG|nr:hypothetical protein K493DRAFT_353468 [Basidiobolus meristosporus CBS 931.73]|eukprot:ORX93406.1 hypothetical protein K493DRAFT_353468 [Basidiobolus meristosporus CBS 931.73]
MKKVIDISSSSVLDFKAELLKHEESFRKERAQGKNAPAASRIQSKKLPAWAKPNKGVEQRSAKDKLEQEAEKPSLDASRKALERKAKLYEKLKRTNLDDMNEKDIEEMLVDFERKQWEQADESDLSEKEKETDDPWVEYIDEFGRTRLLRQSEVPKERSPSPQYEDGLPTMMSADMRRELERERWEAEARAEIAAGPAHYDDAHEIRTKGVGYYRFSTNEEERRAQLLELKNLRNETEQVRALHKNIKDKRKEQLEARKELLRLKRQKRNHKMPEETLSNAEPTIRVSTQTENQAPIDMTSHQLDDAINSFLANMRQRIGK